MRHNALFRRFISALTRGGPGGLPRPIEVHAHDPLRYIGDMLGWLHQVWIGKFWLWLSLVIYLLYTFELITCIVSLFSVPLACQALASERELVLALLDPDAVADTGTTALRSSNVSENDVSKSESDLTFVLDRIFEGVCRPFKVRVEQVLQSQPNLIVSYKLSNTLEFYSYTVSYAWLSHRLFLVSCISLFLHNWSFFFYVYRYQIC